MTITQKLINGYKIRDNLAEPVDKERFPYLAEITQEAILKVNARIELLEMMDNGH